MCKANRNNRIAVVKMIDRLFYEKHNAKRCHKQAYLLYTRPLYGICEQSNQNYLKTPDELMEADPMPEHFPGMFKLDITLVNALPLPEVAKVLNRLCEKAGRAVVQAKLKNLKMNAATILDYMDKPEEGPECGG